MKKLKLEELAEQIFKECEKDREPVTKEEALEMAEMELKAKKINNYVQSTLTKEKKKQEKKQDLEKVKIIKLLFESLNGAEGVAQAEVSNPQKTIEFKIGDSHYSLTLTKHRPKK